MTMCVNEFLAERCPLKFHVNIYSRLGPFPVGPPWARLPVIEGLAAEHLPNTGQTTAIRTDNHTATAQAGQSLLLRLVEAGRRPVVVV